MEKLNYIFGSPQLCVYQDTNSFLVSLDSVLLPHFVTLTKRTKNILDIGTGNAIIPIILSTRTDNYIKGVEIQKSSVELAKKSIAYNKLEKQIEIIEDDIKHYYQVMDTESFDLITCNPPYFKTSEGSHLNDKESKTYARHELSLNLDEIMKISKKLLKNGGRLALVHRPERLVDIIMLMKKYRLEPKKIQFVYPKKNKEANVLLIEGIKNGNPGLKIFDPLYVYDDKNEYTNQILEYVK